MVITICAAFTSTMRAVTRSPLVKVTVTRSPGLMSPASSSNRLVAFWAHAFEIGSNQMVANDRITQWRMIGFMNSVLPLLKRLWGFRQLCMRCNVVLDPQLGAGLSQKFVDGFARLSSLCRIEVEGWNTVQRAFFRKVI